MTLAGSFDPIFILADAIIAAIGIPTIPGPMTPIFLTFQFPKLIGEGLFPINNTHNFDFLRYAISCLPNDF